MAVKKKESKRPVMEAPRARSLSAGEGLSENVISFP